MLFCMLGLGVSNAQLAGTYTINSGNPTSGTNFNSFAAFMSALSSAGNAIAGPVTVNVVANSGPYNEQLVLGTISGAGPGTGGSRIGITINGNGEKLYYSGSGGTENAVITLNGTDYMTFNDLVIERGSSGSYRWGVRLYNNADNNRFDGCSIDVGSYSTSQQICILGSSSNTSYSSYAVHYNDLEIWDCDITGGYGGVWAYGPSSTTGTWINGIDVSNCTFTDQYYYPIRLYYGHYNVKIHGNYFQKINQSYVGGYASYIYRANNIIVTKNHDVGYPYGHLQYYINYYNTGLVNGRSLIANNMVAPNDLAGSASTQYGIYSYYNYDVDFVYNSVNLDGGASTNYGMYIYYASSPTILNNVVRTAASNTNYTMYCYNPSGTVTCDYNTYYNDNGNYTFYLGTTAYTSVSALQSGTGKCTNCQEADPFWVSSTDLHTFGANLYQKGVTFSAVTDDFDGTTRPSVPSAGCHEFTPPQYDAGVVNFVQPVAVCPDTNDIVVTVKNYGVQNLTSFKIHYSWSGNTGSGADSMQINVSGSGIPTGEDTVLFLSNVVMTSGTPGYNFLAWTTKPNGQVDQTHTNDSANYSTQTAMQGTFTIGGTSPDFATFNAAASALNNFGVCDAVVFNVRSGTYTESLTLSTLVGVDSNNTVVFQSDPANSTAPVIQYSSSSSSQGTINLENTSWITFDGLKVVGQSSSYGTAVRVVQGSSHNTFQNCQLVSPSISSTSTYLAVIYVYDANTDYNSFLNNEITGGSYGTYHYGYTGSGNYSSNGASYIGNTFTGSYYRGIYLYYMEDVYIQDNEIQMHSAYSSSYGMYLYAYYSNNVHVDGNEIHANYYNYAAMAGTPNSSPTFTNNIIHVGGASSSNGAYYGIYFNAGFGTFAYNTVISEYKSYAYYNVYLNGGINQVYNNCLVRDGSGYCLYIGSTWALGECDNNNYAALNGATLASNAGSTANDLSTWQSMGWDENGHDAMNLYSNYENITTCNDTLVGNAKPLSNVTMDFYGSPRSMTTPTIGAEEYISPGGFSLSDGDIEFCPGDTITLGQVISGATYTWTPSGDTTATIMVTDAGTYSLTLTTSCGTGQSSVQLVDNSPSAGFSATSAWLTGVFTNSSTNTDTYSWTFGDGSNPSTDENPLHLFPSTGTYNVCLTSTGDCGDANFCQDIFVSDYVGIAENNGAGLVNLYPNPAEDALTIDVRGVRGDQLNIELSNVAGQVLLTRKLNDFDGNTRERVDVRDLSPGVYFVKVYSSDMTTTRRLVIDR